MKIAGIDYTLPFNLEDGRICDAEGRVLGATELLWVLQDWVACKQFIEVGVERLVEEGKTKRKRALLDLLNKLLAIRPINHDELNAKIPFGGKLSELLALERSDPNLGLADCDTEYDGVSVLSLIATITAVLIDDRLAFTVVKDEGKLGVIESVTWYSECKRVK